MDTDFTALLRDGRVWVLESGSTVVGLMVLIESPDSFEVRSVAVLPSYQRKGLGRRLMAHAETLARKSGCSMLRLYTNAKLSELVMYYSSLGYKEEVRKEDQGFERVFMVKRLTSDS